MKCKVEESQCIGCGACAAVYQDTFEINEQGISVVKDETTATPDMVDICPVGAIIIEEETEEQAA
jgi:ferredoxin